MGLDSQGAEKLNLNRDVTIRKTCMRVGNSDRK